MIEVSIEPRELLAGHDCELEIRFTNIGARPCTDLVFRADLPPGFLVLDGRKRVEVPRLGAGEAWVHTMTVRPPVPGSFDVTSTNFAYRDERGMRIRVDGFRAGLTVLQGPPPQPLVPDLDIDVVSGALALGEWDELRLRVRNRGPSPLRAIALTIGGPLRIAASGRQARLPSLAEWQEAEVSYIVCPAEAGRQVPAEVAVRYTDGSGRARAQNQPIPLAVTSTSDPPKRGSAVQDGLFRHEMPQAGGDGVLVLTALDLEYQAVREHLAGLRERVHPQGTLFETGYLPHGGGEITITLTGEGNAGAAVLAERAMSMFGPQAMLFVGVAGALKDDIELGDVVVATRVYAYHGRKEEGDEVMARPRAWDAPHALEQLAHRIARARSWATHLPDDAPGRQPQVHFKPIAAGEVLLASRVTETAEWLRRFYNDAAAIEMEGAGVAQASQFSRSLPALIIRGISDRASGTKSAHDRAGWQPRAAGHAAAFAVALAGEIIARGPGEPGR